MITTTPEPATPEVSRFIESLLRVMQIDPKDTPRFSALADATLLGKAAPSTGTERLFVECVQEGALLLSQKPSSDIRVGPFMASSSTNPIFRTGTVEFASSQGTRPYHVVRARAFSCGFIFDPDTVRVAVVTQFRPPLGRMCIELLGGFIDPLESPEAALRREALEELGAIIPSSPEDLVSLGTTRGFHSTLIQDAHLFFAVATPRRVARTLDNGEKEGEHRAHWIRIPTLAALVGAGALPNAEQEVCWHRAMAHLARVEAKTPAYL